MRKNRNKKRTREPESGKDYEWKVAWHEGENRHTVRVKWSWKFRKKGEKRGREAEVKRIQLWNKRTRRKLTLSPTALSYRVRANGRNICGLINRGRNGGDQHGAVRGLREIAEFSGGGSPVWSGSFPEHWQHFSLFFMCDIKHEIISLVMDDNNLNIHLCFMITYWAAWFLFTNCSPGNLQYWGQGQGRAHTESLSFSPWETNKFSVQDSCIFFQSDLPSCTSHMFFV